MMWKAALVIAVGLLFPLLAFSDAQPEEPPATTPEEGKVTVDAANPATAVLLELLLRFAIAESKGSGLVEMPEAFHQLTPDQQKYVKETLVQRLQVEGNLKNRGPGQRGFCLAGSSLCELGDVVAQMEPCLAGRDCPAVEAWEEAVGEMGIVPAPQTITSASDAQR